MSEGGNSQHERVHFAPKGGNSRNDKVRFTLGRLALLHLAPTGGNSHDEQVGLALEGGKPVGPLGELDLGLVQSLQDPTGLGRWGVVTDCSA